MTQPNEAQISVNLGTEPADHELKAWVREKAARDGYRSMSAFVKRLLVAARKHEQGG